MSTAGATVRTAAAAMLEAVRASAADPADAVRLLAGLAAAQPPSLSPLPGVAARQVALAAMLRRSALVSLARACATYRPTSSNEAAALRRQVLSLFDAEILVAADAGALGSYRALRALRAKVGADLTARGTALPALVTLSVPQPEPSLVVAWRLYGDVRREPLMVSRAGVANPMFMPTTFEALSE